VYYSAGPLSFACGAGNFGKFGLHPDNMKFDTQNKESISINIILRVILRALFCIHHVDKNIPIVMGKLIKIHGQRRRAYRILVGRPEGSRPFGGPRRRWEYNNKIDL
jgi:hypothetical protein